jgi:hypothetical protein
MRKGIRGMPPLSDEERKRFIDDPGIPWMTWLLTIGLKPWIGLGLFIGDSLTLLNLWVIGTPVARIAMVPTLLLLIYLNFLLWSYLWHVPTPEELRASPVSPTLRSPFAVGRWTPDYQTWKEGGRTALADGQIDPNEFL